MNSAKLKETIANIVKEESEYQVFFKKALEKAGKSITDMSDEEKKEFFNKIDAAWDGKGEKNEGNAFGAAVVAAKKAGEDEFEVGGKTYKVEESVNEASMDWETHFKGFNEKELKVIQKFISMNPKGIDGVIQMSKNKDFKPFIQKAAKSGLGESVNEEEIKWNAVENAIINFLKANTKILDKRVQAKDTEGVKGGLKSIISGLTNAQRSLKLESVNEISVRAGLKLRTYLNGRSDIVDYELVKPNYYNAVKGGKTNLFKVINSTHSKIKVGSTEDFSTDDVKAQLKAGVMTVLKESVNEVDTKKANLLRNNMPGYVGPKFAKKASDEDLLAMADLKDEHARIYNRYLKDINDKISKLQKKYNIKESVNEASYVSGYTVKAKTPYEFVNGAYAVLSAYLRDEELGPKGKKELQNILKSLEYMRKYFFFNLSESVNEIKKGSVVIPYAMDKHGEFIVDKVFKNKSGETSYTGKFKKSGESKEFILHSKDKVVKESVNESVNEETSNARILGIDFNISETDNGILFSFKDKKQGNSKVREYGSNKIINLIQNSLDKAFGKGEFFFKGGTHSEFQNGYLFRKNQSGIKLNKLKFESVNEAASRTAMEIGGLTGLNKDVVQKFVDTHNMDIEQVFKYVKMGKMTGRLNFITAVVGTPGNPVQKRMIKMFGESVNEEMGRPVSKTKTVDSRLASGVYVGTVPAPALGTIGTVNLGGKKYQVKALRGSTGPIYTLIGHSAFSKNTGMPFWRNFMNKLQELNGGKGVIFTPASDVKIESVESVNEGRAFINAARKAKQEGKTEFEFNGKKYPVTLKEGTLNEMNPQLNKGVKSLLDKELKDLRKGGSNHLFAVMNVLMGALTDANFHSESKKVPAIFGSKAKYEGDPMAQKDMESLYQSIGERIATMAKWDGEDIAKAVGFYVSMTIGRPLGQKIENLV